MSEANGVGRPRGRRGPRVIHLPSPRRLLRPEPALLVAALALVGAMNAPVGVGADHGPGDGPASTTRVSVAPGPESLRWFDAAERRERGDRLRAVYAVPSPAAGDPTATPVGPVAPPGSFAVPDALWAAYTAAAAAMPQACHLDPRLLAAIGQVESGSLAGRGLDGRHRAVPPVLGPVLDGGSFASIRDTDAGRWDGDRSWDRAVGPMQFIPSTWSRHGRDADGDGVADPQDIEDAALSAAGYLCAGGRDLARPDDLRAAILSYNHSTSYLAAVLALVPNVIPGGADLVLGGGSGTTVAAADAGPASGSTATWAAGVTSSGGSPSATTTATAPSPSSTTSGTTTTTATTPPPTRTSTAASPTSSATSSTTSSPTSTTATTSTTTTTAPTATTTTSPTATTTTAPSSTTSTSPSPTTTTPDPCGTTTTSSTVSSTTTTTATTTPTGTCTATPAPSPSTSSANATEEALGAGTTPTTATTG